MDVLLLEEDALDSGGVALDDDDCEAVREDAAVAPRPRLFLIGDETLLYQKDLFICFV